MSDTSAPSRASLPGSSALREALAQNWWLVLLRGIAAILFGILAFIWPGLTLLTLTLFWGAFALADGVLSLWAAISGRGGAIAPRWWLALVGIAGIIAGLLAFFWPGTTALVLLMFIAIWSIVIGVLEIWGAIQLRKEIEGEWWLILGGLVSIAFGVLLLVRPGAGALALVWTIAWFSMLMGIIFIGLSFRLRKLRLRPEPASGRSPDGAKRNPG